MSYFTPTFIKFFKDLSKNNTTEWFDANRKIYEKEVKQPFAAFVEEMIKRIKKHEPEINIKPADAISRINKDIRFSKDKTPYNTHVSANISPYGKKDKTYPGFYFQFSHDKIVIYGGAFMAEPPALQKIRSYISENQKTFAAAYNDAAFIEKFTGIQGEQSKRLPPEFVAVAEKEPLIANKQFYYTAELKPDILLIDDLPATLMEFYNAGRKLNKFLQAALN